MKRVKLSIIIDERQDQLDEWLTRTMYCAVEIPEDTDIDNVSSTIEEHLKRNSIEGFEKLHFTSMHPSQRMKCVELIGKMNITAKVYVYYNFRENASMAKKINLVKTVRETQYKHRNKELSLLSFFVEHAGEYKGVISKDAMTTDHFLSLIADCYCHVFATRLNGPANTPTVNTINKQMYALLRHQIRLHTYMFGSVKIEDSRANRL